MKKTILRLATALTVFSAFACVALALVNFITEPAIKVNEGIKLKESQSQIFPEAEQFTPIEAGLASDDDAAVIENAWHAVKGDASLGIVIKVKGKSYGGDAVVLIGVGTERRITGVRILSLNDTPGLGANATKPTYFVDKSSRTTFPGQFVGKSVNDNFTVKEDVIPITASTISSKALSTIIKIAAQAGSAWLEAHAAGGN
jgi:electron transport complex protein RnfG